jgi:alkaline phosphatase D
MKRQHIFIVLFIIAILFFSCSKRNTGELTFDFNEIHDRVWIGRDFWAIPMEDWCIQESRLECIGDRYNMRVNVLTHVLSEKKGTLSVSVRMGLLKPGQIASTAGFRIGVYDPEDTDVRAA